MRRALLLAALAAAPARAAERPPITPQRDVDVTYAMANPAPGQPPLAQRMRWSVAAGLLRVDPPTPGVFMIVDYRDKRMSVVKEAAQAVLDLPTAGPGLPGAPAGDYTRQGDATVAGLPCTDWLTKDASGRATTLCLTADGVMLRASLDGNVVVQATAVRYGPQDQAVFQPPPGYRHVQGAVP